MGGRQRTTIFMEKESGKKETKEKQGKEASGSRK